MKVTRRDMLFRIPALALGGLTLGGMIAGCRDDEKTTAGAPQAADPTKTNSLMSSLPLYYPGTEALQSNEMRISFLGTSPIPRLAQECESVFIEVGKGTDGPLDQFIFDVGSGVVAKYNAMGIPFRKMNKVFITHLHGDHTSDLTHIYCFGPSGDRKSPLFVWGPSASGLTDPSSGYVYNDDGLNVFCKTFRDMMRWHSESFSFGATSYASCPTLAKTITDWGLPAGTAPVTPTIGPPDGTTEGYAVVPIELNWSTIGGVAYNNPATGVKITHFPVIHCRKGSIGYKLEWTIPGGGGKRITVIFSGDTKPCYEMINQANNGGSGIDVFIHEMVVPAEVWAAKNLGYADVNSAKSDPRWTAALNYATAVQNSSHTSQGAFGYLLSQMTPSPRLAVATHFQATDDTIASATTSVRNHYPVGDLTFAADFMVLNVTTNNIVLRRAAVNEWAWYPQNKVYPDNNAPKYASPTAQLDLTDEIPTPKDVFGNDTYRTDGY
ncbi:MAG: MBL fold metallo-hydrolase [Pseudomonadota bacterium]|nr:MBL fold metallo-hydrolase [Pseudomonadota bacterium]